MAEEKPTKKPKKVVAPEPTAPEGDGPEGDARENEARPFLLRMAEWKGTKWVAGALATFVAGAFMMPKNPEKPQAQTQPTTALVTPVDPKTTPKTEPTKPNVKPSDPKTTPKTEPTKKIEPIPPKKDPEVKPKETPEELLIKANIEILKTKFDMNWSAFPGGKKEGANFGMAGKFDIKEVKFENGEYILTGRFSRTSSTLNREEGPFYLTLTPDGVLKGKFSADKVFSPKEPNKAVEIKGGPETTLEGKFLVGSDGKFGTLDGKAAFVEFKSPGGERGVTGLMTLSSDSMEKISGKPGQAATLTLKEKSLLVAKSPVTGGDGKKSFVLTFKPDENEVNFSFPGGVGRTKTISGVDFTGSTVSFEEKNPNNKNEYVKNIFPPDKDGKYTKGYQIYYRDGKVFDVNKLDCEVIPRAKTPDMKR